MEEHGHVNPRMNLTEYYMIHLGGEGDERKEGANRILNQLLSTDVPYEDKVRLLEEATGLPLSQKEKEGIREMGEYSAYVVEKTTRKVRKETMEQAKHEIEAAKQETEAAKQETEAAKQETELLTLNCLTILMEDKKRTIDEAMELIGISSDLKDKFRKLLGQPLQKV